METNDIIAQKEFLIQSVKFVRPVDVVVILASITALYLFRLPDGHHLNPIWQLKEPSSAQHHIYAQPLITDIDGNGLKELILVSKDKIKIFTHHAGDFDETASENSRSEDDTTEGVLYHLHLKNKRRLDDIVGREPVATYPVAMNAGCIAAFHKELCLQALAIVWSDWTVTLFSDQLKLLWKAKPMKIPFHSKLQLTEMAVLIVQNNTSVFGENGLVIVGGVLNPKEHELADLPRHDHSRPTVPSKMSDEISKERAGVEPNASNHAFSHHLELGLAKYVGHFTTYALDGKTGGIRWKHEPGDFEPQQEPDEGKQSQLHFKLRLRKKRLHSGEVHWKKYSSSFLNHLPYAWKHYSDSDVALGSFTRSSVSKSSKPSDNIIPEQLLTFIRKNGIPKPSEAKEEEDSNVVVLRHQHAIEVLSLENGKPVCSLPLDGTKTSSFGDINGDEVVDVVKMYIYQESSASAPSCFIVASDGLTGSSIHFNSSVCHPVSPLNFFEGEDTTILQDTKLSSLPPLLIKPLERSSGVLHHVLGYGLSRVQTGFESFVLLSSGKLVAFGPSGRFLWQVETGSGWSDRDFENDYFPSMKPISLNSEGIQDAVVTVGPHDIVVVSLVDGSILSTHSLPCVSTQPLVTGDINNDISDEFLVRCSDRWDKIPLDKELHIRELSSDTIYSRDYLKENMAVDE